MATLYPKIAGTPSGSVEVLYKTNVQYSSAGAAGNTELLTYTLPANTMGANDSLRITTLWSCDNTANAKQATIYFGSGATDIFACNLADENGLQAMTMVHANNSTSAQKCFGKFQTEGMSFREYNAANEALSIDTTADVDIGFRAEGMTATEDLNIESVTIEIIRAP